MLWEGKHSQVPVRSEACPCIISPNSIVPCSLVPAEHTPSEFVTTHINQFGPREVLTRGPDASEGRRTCRPQLEIDPRTSPVRHHRPLAGERITAAARFRRGKGAPANSFSLRPPPPGDRASRVRPRPAAAALGLATAFVPVRGKIPDRQVAGVFRLIVTIAFGRGGEHCLLNCRR